MDPMIIFVVGAVLAVLILVITFFFFFTRKGKNKNKEVASEVLPITVDLPPLTQEEPVFPPPLVEEPDFSSSKTLNQALEKTEKNLFGRIRLLFSKADSQQHIDEIEEILYTSDLGTKTVQRLMNSIEENLNASEKMSLESIKNQLRKEFLQIFLQSQSQSSSQSQNPIQSQMLDDQVSSPKTSFLCHDLKLNFQPSVWMVVGVNGAGKTTSIGKLAAHLAKNGKRVLVAAGDTFRAAAGGQLKVWTERAQVEIFSPIGVTDPSAVAFDAIAKAKAQAYDVVIVDTAGRLHTQVNLMEELKKMKRVMGKVIEEAPHEVLIVLDANNGQNALVQALEFHKALQLTGVILTKMDGTAKGGVAVGIANELQIPIRLIGVGEKIGDLQFFSPERFVDSIFHQME